MTLVSARENISTRCNIARWDWARRGGAGWGIPRTSVEATQSGSILMKKGLETMKATLKKAWLEDLMQFLCSRRVRF
jgi:hypothetical protein